MAYRDYTVPDCVQFVEDMENAGLFVEHYMGRFFWEGPSVVVRSLQDALSNTKVKCQWDNMGLDWVVYPLDRDMGIMPIDGPRI